MNLQNRLARLEDEVEQLRLSAKESANERDPNSQGTDDSSGRPEYFEVRDALQDIMAMTREIFPGDVEYLEKEDCEIPGERYFTLRVVDSGSLDETLVKYHEWHARLNIFRPEIRSLFRLSVDARK